MELTTFDHQVLQAMAADLPDDCIDEDIIIEGRGLFGINWGGRSVMNARGWPRYPRVNLALGRLQSMGLVTRSEMDPPKSTVDGGTPPGALGVWSVSPQGHTLVGTSH